MKFGFFELELMLTKYIPMRGGSTLEKVTQASIVNSSDSSSETSYLEAESDDNPKRFSKARLKSKLRTGSYNLCADEYLPSKVDLNQSLKEDSPKNLSKPRNRKKCYRRKNKKKVNLSQSYSVFNAEIEFGLIKCSPNSAELKGGDRTSDRIKTKSPNSAIDCVPTYRKLREDEVDCSKVSETATNDASSTSDIESIYETSCSSTSCGSSTPFFSQNPSDNTSGVLNPAQSLHRAIPVLAIDKTMDTGGNLIDHSAPHTCQPMIHKLPAVSPVPLHFSPDIYAVNKILAPNNVEMSPRGDGGPITYELTNPISGTGDLETEKFEDMRCISPGRLFPAHFEGKTKNGVYIKSQGIRPNVKESFVPGDPTATENYIVPIHHDPLHNTNLTNYLGHLQKSPIDFSLMEGERLDEASSKWMMNRNSFGALQLRRKRNHALSRVKESLGLLLPHNVSKQSRKVNLKLNSNNPSLKKDNKFSIKWFQKMNTEGNQTSTTKTNQDQKHNPSNGIKKNGDYFIKARYNGFESGIIQAPSHDNIFGIIQEYGNDSQLFQTTAQVHHGAYRKYPPTRYVMSEDELIGSRCIIPAGQTYSKTDSPLQPHVLPRKGILKKAGSLDSNENLGSNSTDKRKRNVVTYDLPVKETSLEADYDSIEQNAVALVKTSPTSDANQLKGDHPTRSENSFSKDATSVNGKERDSPDYSSQSQNLSPAIYENIQVVTNDLLPAKSYSRHHWQGAVSPVSNINLTKSEKLETASKNTFSENSCENFNMSSISSRGSICSTKASFDSMRLNFNKGLVSDVSKFGTIDNFTSNFPAFETTVDYSSRKIEKKMNFKSAIPISTRMKEKSMPRENCKSQGTSSPAYSTTNKNLNNLRLSEEKMSKPNYYYLTNSDILPPAGVKDRTRVIGQTEDVMNIPHSESSLKVEELNNYESYCIVNPTTSVSIQSNEYSPEQTPTSSYYKSLSPRRPFRRPSVSLLARIKL